MASATGSVFSAGFANGAGRREDIALSRCHSFTAHASLSLKQETNARSSLSCRFQSQFATVVVVHVEEFNGATSDGSETDDPIPVQEEMFVPVLRSRVKQRDQHAIDFGRQICAFAKIAPVARKAQIEIVIRPAVLSCHDMFDVKRNERENFLMTSAILAAILGTLADPSSCGSVN